MTDELDKFNAAYYMQKHVCEILNADSALSVIGATFFPENSMDIDYEIRNAISRQGLACVVMTPTLTYEGHDGVEQEFTADDLTLQVVENPAVNRPRLKKLGLSAGTALDVCNVASRKLAGPQGGHFGEFCTQTIQQGEDNGLIVAKVVLDCTFSQDLSGVLSSSAGGTWIYLPYAYKTDLSVLSIVLEEEISAAKGNITALYNPTRTRWLGGDLYYYRQADEWTLSDNLAGGVYTLDKVSDTLWRCATDETKNLEWSTGQNYWILNGAYTFAGTSADTEINFNNGALVYKRSAGWNLIDKVVLSSELPLSVSQLCNDAGYITRADVPLGNYLPLSGGTMTGAIVIGATPAVIQTSKSGWSNKIAGDSYDGKLYYLDEDVMPTDDYEIANKKYVDGKGYLSKDGGEITTGAGFGDLDNYTALVYVEGKWNYSKATDVNKYDTSITELARKADISAFATTAWVEEKIGNIAAILAEING